MKKNPEDCDVCDRKTKRLSSEQKQLSMTWLGGDGKEKKAKLHNWKWTRKLFILDIGHAVCTKLSQLLEHFSSIKEIFKNPFCFKRFSKAKVMWGNEQFEYSYYEIFLKPKVTKYYGKELMWCQFQGKNETNDEMSRNDLFIVFSRNSYIFSQSFLGILYKYVVYFVYLYL